MGRYDRGVTTRRGLLWGAPGAVLFLGKAGLTGFPKSLVMDVAGKGADWPTDSLLSPTLLRQLAEETRKVLATLTPSEEAELRRRFGVG